MYTLKVQPEGGELYELTHDYGEFIITRIEGLCPPISSINISGNGIQDGGAFNSSRLGSRNLVLNITLRGNIDASRRKLYGLFPQNVKVTIYFQDGVRHMKVIGYVEHPDCCPFDFPSVMMISVICPDPYWHDTETVTETIPAFETTVIDNTGDAATGFTARVTFASQSQPSVTLSETSQELDAVYPYDSSLLLYPEDSGVPVSYDPDTQKICELSVDGALTGNFIATIDTIVKKDSAEDTGTEYVAVMISGGGYIFSPAHTTTYRIMSESGGGSVDSFTCTGHDSRYFSDGPNDHSSNANFGQIDFDDTKDAARVYLRNASGVWEQVLAYYELYHSSGGWYVHFSQRNIRTDGTTACRMYVYHDTAGADIRQTLQISAPYTEQTDGTEWWIHCYDDVPAGYDADKDVLYIDGVRTDGDVLSSVIVVPESGGAGTSCSIIPGSNAEEITFRYVHSINGDDIRDYTEDQIDAGLAGTAYTRGLCIWNNTTGEWLLFKNSRFQLGDVLAVSTIPGELYAKIVERSGEVASISLLHDCYRYGTFFRLQRGENELEITAESGSEYVSATLTAELLYTGV